MKEDEHKATAKKISASVRTKESLEEASNKKTLADSETIHKAAESKSLQSSEAEVSFVSRPLQAAIERHPESNL